MAGPFGHSCHGFGRMRGYVSSKKKKKKNYEKPQDTLAQFLKYVEGLGSGNGSGGLCDIGRLGRRVRIVYITIGKKV